MRKYTAQRRGGHRARSSCDGVAGSASTRHRPCTHERKPDEKWPLKTGLTRWQTGISPTNRSPFSGMGCRLPGGVNSPDDLWQLLLAERDAVSEFPR